MNIIILIANSEHRHDFQVCVLQQLVGTEGENSFEVKIPSHVRDTNGTKVDPNRSVTSNPKIDRLNQADPNRVEK